jgi:hypothetical protein
VTSILRSTLAERVREVGGGKGERPSTGKQAFRAALETRKLEREEELIHERSKWRFSDGLFRASPVRPKSCLIQPSEILLL